MTRSTALVRSGIPLHRQLDAILRDQIAGARMQPCDRFPTESELCLRYGVSRAAGTPVACSRFWAEAILAEPRFAMILKSPLGSPVLSLWWVETLGGKPALCSQMLRPGAHVAVDFGAKRRAAAAR